MQRAALQHAETTGRNGNSAYNGQHCTMKKRRDLKFQMQNRQKDRLQRTALHHATGRADNMQCCNMLLQPATCSVASTCSMQQTALQRTPCNMQRTALQGAQQTSCSRPHCNMPRKTCNGPPWCRGTARASRRRVHSAPCGGSKRRGPF